MKLSMKYNKYCIKSKHEGDMIFYENNSFVFGFIFLSQCPDKI